MLMTKDSLLAQIEDLLNIGIALSAENDHNQVLEMILTKARDITNADAGTLFICQDNRLSFKMLQNETLNIFQGAGGEEIDLPDVVVSKENVAGYTALTRTIVNIPDVYQTDKFKFKGPKEYDKITGYRTTSMLVAPMEDHEGKIIGVLQLINAKNSAGEVIPFDQRYEKLISSLASQAAVSLTNIQILEELAELLNSLVEVMATAVDARTPYNVKHTRRVALLCQGFINSINQTHKGRLADTYFDQERTEQLIMAAWLHDIGKISTPLAVMNKASRLEDKLTLILQRFDYIAAKISLEYWQEKARKQNGILTITEERLKELENARELIIQANDPAIFIDEQMADKLNRIAASTYITHTGSKKHWLTEEELEALKVPRGTLTTAERNIIEKHVTLAWKILQRIPFPEKFKKVPDFVAMHHELLDGSGYPRGLSGDDIPLEGRILAIVDIFEALTAGDRPYKKAKPIEIALDIVGQMVTAGKLDGDLFALLKENKIWLTVEEELAS